MSELAMKPEGATEDGHLTQHALDLVSAEAFSGQSVKRVHHTKVLILGPRS